jgi:hypothetical protein
MSNLLESPEHSTAIRVIRGVGSSIEDADIVSCKGLLDKRGVDTSYAEEINWSWASFVKWPYSDGTSTSEDSGIFISMEFARKLCLAFRAAGRRQHNTESNWAIENIGVQVFRVHELFPLALGLGVFGALIGIPHVLHVMLLSIIAVVGISCIVTLACADRLTLYGRFRSVLLPVLWPIVFLFTLPGTILWAFPVAFILMTLLSYRVAERLIPYSWLTSGHGATSTPVYSNDLLELVATIVAAPIWLVSIFVLATIYFCLRTILSPIFKVLADIFLYIGDAQYRRGLLDYVQRSCQKAADCGCRRMVMLTHSLGTVIAVDHLRSLPANVPHNDVVLITTGSPLWRYFRRFFAADYPSPQALCDELASKYRSFKWINIYRPLDPIGGRLRLSPACDISTGQLLLGVSAHTNYWNDSKGAIVKSCG